MEPVVEINGRVIYSLQPKQLETLGLTPLVRRPEEPYPTHIGYGGAAGGGKSMLARVVLTLAALKWPGSTGIVFRRTRPEVRDNHLVKFRQEVPDFGGKLYSLAAQDGVVTWANGSRTLFGYLEREDDVFRYQGNEYDVIVFEESTHYSWRQVSWLTGNRLRSSIPGTRPFALYPSNPGNRGHFWYKRIFVDRRYDRRRGEVPSDYAFVQASVYDNMELLARDPAYVERLEKLDEPDRSWLLYGDWKAGAGQALDLDPLVHIADPFEIPREWSLFSSHDWGFAHPFSWGLYTTSPEGVVYKLSTVTGRRLHEPEIIERVNERLHSLDFLANHPKRFTHHVAGHDCWSDIRAKVENVPTSAEQYATLGWPVQRASVSRIAGLKNMRAYVRHGRPDQLTPRFQWFDSEDNRACFEQIQTMVTDPDNPEDALKRDADEYGEGGDDMYDETRYGLASRPLVAPAAKAPPRPAQEHYDDRLERIAREAASRGTKRGGGGAPNRAPLR